MKYLLFFLCLKTGLLFAQDVHISVLSDGTPVEYANLFINNKLYGSSDSMGFILVAESDISDGDTISVSFVGMETRTIIYQSNNYDSGKIVVHLASDFLLEEVVVFGRDMAKQLLKRHVKDYFTATWFTRYKGDYKITLNNKNYKGSFTYTMYHPKYAKDNNLDYVKLIPEIEASEESSNIKNTILNIILSSMSTVRIKSVYSETQDMKVRYLGKESGCHLFSLIKPIPANRMIKQDGFQAIIYADQKSREIVSAKTIIVTSNDKLNLDFSTKYNAHRAGWFAHIYHPYRIEGKVFNEHNKTDFLIENITFGQ